MTNETCEKQEEAQGQIKVELDDKNKFVIRTKDAEITEASQKIQRLNYEKQFILAALIKESEFKDNEINWQLDEDYNLVEAKPPV